MADCRLTSFEVCIKNWDLPVRFLESVKNEWMDEGRMIRKKIK